LGVPFQKQRPCQWPATANCGYFAPIEDVGCAVHICIHEDVVGFAVVESSMLASVLVLFSA